MLYIIYQEDGPDGAALRAQHRDTHFAYLDKHKDILVLGGAMIAEDGATRTGSVLILNVPNLAEAEATRKIWERRVAALRNQSLEPDMLDERARVLLNFARKDDIVVFMPTR